MAVAAVTKEPRGAASRGWRAAFLRRHYPDQVYGYVSAVAASQIKAAVAPRARAQCRWRR
jgi:hypothetical protein